MTKKQRIAKLEKHLGDLRDEAKAVEEHIAQIMGENWLRVLETTWGS